MKHGEQLLADYHSYPMVDAISMDEFDEMFSRVALETEQTAAQHYQQSKSVATKAGEKTAHILTNIIVVIILFAIGWGAVSLF